MPLWFVVELFQKRKKIETIIILLCSEDWV